MSNQLFREWTWVYVQRWEEEVHCLSQTSNKSLPHHRSETKHELTFHGTNWRLFLEGTNHVPMRHILNIVSVRKIPSVWEFLHNTLLRLFNSKDQQNSRDVKAENIYLFVTAGCLKDYTTNWVLHLLQFLFFDNYTKRRGAACFILKKKSGLVH